jgi:hypothetical protein
MAIAHAAPMPSNLAIAYMCSIAFFYLLRLGEYYTVSPSEESTHFRLCDIQLRIGNRRLDLLLATDADIRSVTFATLTFTTTQKNGVRGEVIGLSRSGNPQLLCPVTMSLCNRILHAREHHADLTAPPLPATLTDTNWNILQDQRAW